MPQRAYWLDLFTPATWQEFLDAGASVSGFRGSRWNAVRQLKPGDYLICYLTQVSRIIAILEVTSEPFQDSETKIWKNEVFPSRVEVRVVVAVPIEESVPITELADQLTFFQNLKSPMAWTGLVRTSPVRWKSEDGEIIVAAMLDAQANPVHREIDPRKLAPKPTTVETTFGTVTVPPNETAGAAADRNNGSTSVPGEESAHTEIQWRLLTLGSAMGLDVWVARNDRNRSHRMQSFADIPKLRASIPNQFDEATNRTIELIDVIWLRGNAFQAAFEIESTTSIYSGLLRMSDLVAMQPNLNIPLYLVAPDERRNKVLSEVNRPTFSRLTPPLRSVCRYLAFSVIREQFPEDPRLIRHLGPTFLDEYSESCEIDSL